METSDSSSAESAGDSCSQAIDQLSELCRRHPIARKVVFVPYTQLGHELNTAVARHRGGVGGLECQTPRSYALRRVRASDRLRGRDHLGDTKRTLLVQSLLSKAERATKLGTVTQIARLAPQLSEAIQTLRLGKVGPDTVRGRAETEQGFLPLLAETYGRYEKALESYALYDDADVFAEAVHVVSESEEARGAVYSTFGETELHESALDLMATLRDLGRAFYGVGAEAAEDAPKMTAAFNFFQESSSEGAQGPVRTQEQPSVEYLSPRPAVKESIQFQRAVGPLREVRSVLRDLLQQGRPLDEVEIAYTASTPYLTLLADEAERLGLPFTLATGLPLTATRPGQCISGFYEWIESGYDVSVLIRLLRSGLLQTRKWSDGRERPVSMSGRQIANVLASHRYGPGSEAYGKTIDAVIEAVKNDITSTDDGLPESEETRIQQLNETNAFVENLIGLIPDSGSAQGLAAGSLTFLNVFGPDLRSEPEDVMVSEEAKTAEEIAEAVLRYQILEEIQSVPFDVGETPQQTARVLREMTEQRYVGAQNATSGAVHIVPLDSAGASGREFLYVVGMDSETAASPSIDTSILNSEDRGALSKPMDGGLPQPRNRAEESAWRFDQALARHRGDLTLVATTFDPNEGESRHPSTLYLEKRHARTERQAQEAGEMQNTSNVRKPKEPIEGLIPASSTTRARTVFLSDSESWIASAPAASRFWGEQLSNKNADELQLTSERSEETSSRPTAREMLHRTYPWIQHGEKARLARASEKYTVYDGLLETDTPELDFLSSEYTGPPISAGRLEMLAGAPYAYFLKYVLRVEPREEPALEEEPWLNPRRKGAILHRAFSRFMRENDGGLHISDWEDLRSIVEEITKDEAGRVHPGTDATLQAAVRELERCARLFLKSEVRHTGRAEPLLHEWGFGYSEKHRQEGDIGDVELHLEQGSFPVRGRIDRVDRTADGVLVVWDYKTGSQSSFSREAPLKHGEKIQWALYALTLEQHRGDQVSESGYFFTSEKEMGTRLVFRFTDEVRKGTADTISHLSSLARSGSFPIAHDAHRNRPWRFGDWDHLHRDLKERVDVFEKKSLFAEGLQGKVRPHFLEDPDG